MCEKWGRVSFWSNFILFSFFVDFFLFHGIREKIDFISNLTALKTTEKSPSWDLYFSFSLNSVSVFIYKIIFCSVTFSDWIVRAIINYNENLVMCFCIFQWEILQWNKVKIRFGTGTSSMWFSTRFIAPLSHWILVEYFLAEPQPVMFAPKFNARTQKSERSKLEYRSLCVSNMENTYPCILILVRIN